MNHKIMGLPYPLIAAIAQVLCGVVNDDVTAVM